MSGYNSRFLYDSCTIDTNLVQYTAPCRYDLLVDKYENDTMTIDKVPCEGKLTKVGCNTCNSNKSANIEAKWSSIGQRTDIESDLIWLTRPNTRCPDLKYHPCGKNCGKDKCNKCTKQVVVNTRVCDRHIVPTNNKMPTKTGF